MAAFTPSAAAALLALAAAPPDAQPAPQAQPPPLKLRQIHTVAAGPALLQSVALDLFVALAGASPSGTVAADLRARSGFSPTLGHGIASPAALTALRNAL